MANTRWCFTLNNYTSTEEDLVKNIQCRYLVFGKETAPTTGTPHLQGFLILPKRARMRTVKSLFPERVHLEQAKGSSLQASTYCKKEGNFFEKGECPKDPGTTGIERWDAARKAAEEGRFDDIPSDLWSRHMSNFMKMAILKQVNPAPVDILDFHWWTGETGTGKSSTARSQNPGYYEKMINKWWDGYTDQKTVLIEEWCPMDPSAERIMGTYLKRWCDHHPFMAEFKGYAKSIRPSKIIITSNYTMEDCFHDQNILVPLKRRIRVTHFHNYFPPPISAADQYFTPPQFPCSPTQPQ